MLWHGGLNGPRGRPLPTASSSLDASKEFVHAVYERRLFYDTADPAERAEIAEEKPAKRNGGGGRATAGQPA